uniref:Uncharacterized protein n=1 Tax=Anguilla anguilla TaxID=7936 RepID=A0A0E9QGD3_ANGAN
MYVLALLTRLSMPCIYSCKLTLLHFVLINNVNMQCHSMSSL